MSGAGKKPPVLSQYIYSGTDVLRWCSVDTHRPALARLGKLSGKASEILKGLCQVS